MLEELRIRGLGVIDDAVLPLGPGLTVVTGETGAGKTMVVTGLLLLFGGRADAARVRIGADQASVDGRLEIADDAVANRVRDAGGELDDGTALVLRRTVSAAGRSRAYVGGVAAPVAVLGELSERLLAVHGQSDQLRMTRPAQQRGALDRFVGIDLVEYSAAYEQWRAASAALADRTSRMAELRREADLLEHGLLEIETADPQPGEDVELSALASRLAHADALRLASGLAHDALLGGDDPGAEATDVVSLLSVVRRTLAQQEGDDAALDALTSRLVDLSTVAADLGAEFGAYTDQLDADPTRLAQIEERRAVLAALVRRYGDGPEPSIDAVIAWRAEAATRLAELDVSDEAIAELERRREVAAATLARLATDLTARRSAGAAELAAAVTEELAGLAMPNAAVSVEVRPRSVSAGAETVGSPPIAVGASGADEVEFLLRSHAEAPPLPLAKGASGGELSRVMLALEVCLAGTDPVPTMIFDEVDAGVGGRAAVEVGRRLARLSRAHQVVVVTHLPQVAAFADRHIVVDKATDAQAGVTASDVHPVEGDERVAELARMLAGTSTTAAREHAAELLSDAADERRNTVRTSARKGTKTRA
ncbi:DNA repair protein RecN [Jatrophihabitans sp.]|uniref:DNA repair protein RecN n=1 Tax=Jatrophihabitans sp. TaxID=1932789 RepID=UPI0030C68953|nr:repair protein RecN [Jatrophihabitans sp.]